MVSVAARSALRFAEHAFPARTPIRSWEGFWEFLESLPGRSGRVVPRPTGHNPDTSAYARIDDGRWIADCPWGCGAAFNLPQDATWMWCTECAGGGWGNTAVLVWPPDLGRLTANVESLPAMLQHWPCIGCQAKLGTGTLCEACRGMLGEAV